jgi:hypothetical protein
MYNEQDNQGGDSTTENYQGNYRYYVTDVSSQRTLFVFSVLLSGTKGVITAPDPIRLNSTRLNPIGARSSDIFFHSSLIES